MMNFYIPLRLRVGSWLKKKDPNAGQKTGGRTPISRWRTGLTILSMLMFGQFMSAQSYCVPTYTYDGDYLSYVKLTSSQSVVEYSAAEPPAFNYSDLTADPSKVLSIESGTVLTFNTTYIGGSNGVRAWIDFGGDGVFDASDLVATESSGLASKLFTYLVPVDVASGDYRIRLRSQYGSTATPDPCATHSFGSTVDFTIRVIATTSCQSPGNIQIVGSTHDEVSFSLGSSPSAVSREIQYGPQGFELGTGTVQTFTGNSYVLSGLTTSVTYSVYFRNLCDEYSNWSGPFNVTPNYLFTSNEEVGTLYVSSTATVLPTSSCPATLTIEVPAGKRIASVTTSYQMTAGNGAWKSEQRSYIKSPSMGSGETTLTAGLGGSAGTYTYNRTLAFAKHATGTVMFELHPFRTYGDSSLLECDGYYNYVESGTWTLSPVFEDIPSCPEPTTLVATSVAGDNAQLSWVSSGTNFEIQYGPSGFTLGDGIVQTSSTNSITLNGLSSLTTYDVYVRTICDGEESVWSDATSFTTKQIPATIPLFEDFESAAGFEINNGTQVNKFFVGSAVNNGGAKSLYVSNTAGATNVYSTSSGSTTHAFRDLNIPVDADALKLTFDWKSEGEAGFDYLRVWVVPASAVLTPGTQISTSNTPGAIQLGGNHQIQSTFTTSSYQFPVTDHQGGVMRLVFEWRNDSSSGTQPPVAIDNVSVEKVECIIPTALTASMIKNNSISLNWNSTHTDFEIEFNEVGDEPTTLTVSGNSHEITELESGVTYSVRIRSICGDSFSDWSTPITVTTASVLPLPWEEPFATSGLPSQWVGNNFSTVSNVASLGTSSIYLYKNLYSGSASTGSFMTPYMGVVGANFALTFDYGLADWSSSSTTAPGAGSGNFTVEITNDFGVTWTVLETVENDGVRGWKNKFYSLEDYVGDIIRIRISATRISGDYYLGFDNFVISEVCNGAPEGGVVDITEQNICAGYPVMTLEVTSENGLGVVYQWQQSTDNGDTWIDVVGGTGANTLEYTPVNFDGNRILYRLKSTCITSGDESFSTISEVNSNPRQIPFTEGFDSLTDLGGYSVSGTATMGWGNTRGAVGNPGPNLYANLYSTTYNSAILTSPSFGVVGVEHAILFDYKVSKYASPYDPGNAGAIQVTVSVSTDCGVNFTPLSTFLSESVAGYTTKIISLADYVGQNVMVRIAAAWQTGGGDVDFSIDNLSIMIPPPTISALSATAVCADLSFDITGDFFNDITSVMVGGYPVSYTVNSPQSITVNLNNTVVPDIYTVSVTNVHGTATSAGTIELKAVPSVSPIQGAQSEVCSGSTISLTNVNPGGVWASTNPSVATVSGGVVTGVTAGEAQITYTVTDLGCSTTVAYTVTVHDAIVVTSQPVSIGIQTGNSGEIEVEAIGSSLSYQWMYSDDYGSSWQVLENDDVFSGVTTNNLLITEVPQDYNDWMFYCQIDGATACSSVDSDIVSLSVGNTAVVQQPISQTLCNTGVAIFEISTVGDVQFIQWMMDDGNGAVEIYDDANFDGVNSETLTVSGIDSSFNGYEFIAYVIGAENEVFSNRAILTVNTDIILTSSSPAETKMCYGGSEASLNFTATSNATQFQWQYSLDGATYANVSTSSIQGFSFSGVTTQVLDVTTDATAASGIYYFRLVANGSMACNEVISETKAIAITAPVSVQSDNLAYCLPGGSPVVLTAQGAVTYTWSPSTGLNTTTGDTVIATPTTETTYTVTGVDANGCTTTATVTVTIGTSFDVTAIASQTEVCEGTSVQLNVSSSIPLGVGINRYFIENKAGVVLEDMTDSTRIISTSQDDTASALLNIGFDFVFNGTTVTQFSASSNGLMRLGSTRVATSWSNTATNLTANLLFAYWDDLNTKSDGGVFMKVVGTAPNRKLVVEWKVGVPNSSSTANARYQVWLHEGSNAFEFVYGNGIVANTNAYSVGISNSTSDYRTLNASGTFVNTPFSTLTTAIPAGTAYRFSPQTYSYQWTSIPEGFTSTVANPTVVANASAEYTVVVTNDVTGCLSSSVVTVGLTSGVVIEEQPTDVNVCLGQPISLEVVASGPALTYQWRLNGANIAGATSRTYTVASTTGAHEGMYDVVITPGCGEAMVSEQAEVSFYPIPSAAITGTSSVCVGETISLSAVSDYGATYTWTGPNGFTATGQNVQITSASVASTGSYVVEVTSAYGCTSSAMFSVAVSDAPQIVLSHANTVAACEGELVTLNATAAPVVTNVMIQDFEHGLNGWTVQNNTTGGSNPSLVAFKILPSPTTISSNITISNDSSNFINANADAGGSGVSANTSITSPVFSTVGLNSATLSFHHYYRHSTAIFVGVEYSVNGSNWSTLRSFTTTRGSSTAFVEEIVDLPAAALNQPQVSIRFRYVTGWAWNWNIDNIKVSGQTTPELTWSPIDGLYVDAQGRIPYTGESANTVYSFASASSPVYTVVSTANGCADAEDVTFAIRTTNCPPTTVIQPSQCGVTLSSISSYIYASNVTGAQGYRFKVTDMETGVVQIVDRFTRTLRISELSNYAFDRSYEVAVSVKLNNVWVNYYGSECIITTPAAFTQVQTSQCGITIGSMTDYIYADIVQHVTGYRFRITNVANPSEVFVVDSATRAFRFSQISNASFETLYTVEVALKNTDGTYMDYGTACAITTPMFPTTSLTDQYCDAVVTANATLYVNNLANATKYRVTITDGVTAQSVDYNLRAIDLGRFSGLVAGTEYTVSVQAMINGVWGPAGKNCTITIATSARTIDNSDVNGFEAIAYPNPFANDFQLSVRSNSTAPVTVVVYDMAGRLLETKSIQVTEMNNYRIGQMYPAGVYNVIVTQESDAKTIRVVKH